MIVACFALYAVLLFAGLRLGISIVLENAVAQTALVGMSAASSTPVVRSVTVARTDGRVSYQLRVSMDDQSVDGTFSHTFHTQNLLLIIALALATPGLALRQRALAFAAGFALVFAIDVLITMGDLFLAERTGMNIDARHGASWQLSQVGQLLRFMHPTGGAFMAPIFAWGLLLLGPYRRPVLSALQRAEPEAAPS